MIQRHSPTIRREESTEELSPNEYNQLSPPNPPLQNYPIETPPPTQPPVKKSRGRPQKQYWTHEWSDRATEALIEMWSEKEELYNKQHPMFYVKESKDRAVDEIRDRLREKGYDVTSNNILSKFQSLRTYFCTQRTKHMTTRRPGGASFMGVDGDTGECKWRFYKSLMFLDDNMKPRESHRKMELINAEFIGSAPPSFTSSPSDLITRARGNYHSHSSVSEYIHHSPEGNGYHNTNSNHHDGGPFDDPPMNASSRDFMIGSITSSLGDPNLGSVKLEPKFTTSTSNQLPLFTSSSASLSSPNVQHHNKHEDFIFGELVGNMIHQLPEGQHKDMVKLEIQQLIIKAKYTSNSKNESNLEGSDT